MARSPGLVYTLQLFAQLRLGFLRLPYSVNLATKYKSLTHYTKGTQSQVFLLPLLVRTRFQVLFHSSPGFFSPFLHSTGSLSVNQEYLALEDGPPFFKQDITCPALLLVSLVPQYGFRYGIITLFDCVSNTFS